MKVVSFNVNGIRARQHQLETLVNDYQPDIIGLQETKVQDDLFPVADVEGLGYAVNYHGQKSHYGVALMSKATPAAVFKGFAHDDEDAQKRLISGQFELANGKTLTVINGYFPQGESRDHPTKFPNKAKFYEDLQSLLEEQFTPQDYLIVMGDLNISRVDLDIGIGEDNRKRWLRTGKCSFLPEEREWMDRLMRWGLFDTFREQYPDEDSLFSWFDYRSKGFDREPKRGLRIDLVLATQPLLDALTATGIAYDIRGLEKPSDHAPVWAEFDLD
ncbi:MAG: exodeoxyribonuclease III [Pseudomonadales bacterium]|nr:exodeoxyribonuclease III [Pseudomonadales bacterium]